MEALKDFKKDVSKSEMKGEMMSDAVETGYYYDDTEDQVQDIYN